MTLLPTLQCSVGRSRLHHAASVHQPQVAGRHQLDEGGHELGYVPTGRQANVMCARIF